MKLRTAIIASVIIAGLGGWLLLFSSSAAPASTEVKLYLHPSQLATNQGQTFSEAIRLSKVGNEKVDYVSAQLTFPVKLIEVKSVSRSGSAFNNGAGLQVAYNNSKGTLSATGSGTALANPADVLVVTITFVAKTTGQAGLKFSVNSQAGALLGNNTVKNALDTMVGSVVSIAATTTQSSTTPTSNSGSGGKPPSAGSTAKPEPAITTPAAQPNSTSILNEAPQSDAGTVPVGSTAKQASTSHPWSLTLWLVIAGLVAVVLGGLIAWLYVSPKNYSRQADARDSDSKIISPQREDTASDKMEDAPTQFAANYAKETGTAQAAPEGKGAWESVPPQAEPAPATTASQVRPSEPQPSKPAQSTAAATPSASAGPVPAPSSAPVATSKALSSSPANGVEVATPASAKPPAASNRPPVQSVDGQDGDTVPDMFDDGEKRLKSEGL